MWLIFTLATTLIWGIGELFYKKGSHAENKYDHLRVCICVGAVMGIHAIVVLVTSGIQYDPINLLKYLPVSLCYIISMAFSFFGVRFIEESISDPIENTSGAICCLLCAVFLGTRISPLAALAVVIIVIGIIGVGYLERNGSTDRSRKLGKRMAVIAFAMPFLYAILDAVGSFMDIYYLDIKLSPLVGITDDNIELIANTSYELTFAICAIVLFTYMRAKGERFELPRQRDKIIAAICETAGQFTYVYAMSGNGAIAAPIISGVCVVSLLLSRIFLKEKLTGKQYFFIGLVLVGILLLAVVEGE